MKPRTCRFAATALMTLLVIPVSLAAQDHRAALPRYSVKDLGTLWDHGQGGSSWLFTGPPSFYVLNNRGIVVDASDTMNTDPYHPCFIDCNVSHAAQWQNGVLTDLGSLPGRKTSSAPFSISDNGQFIVGVSENGVDDHLTDYPEYDAVLWRRGHRIKNLGTFGGNVSTAVSVNNLGQVVGGATNTISDQYASGLGPCWSLNCWPAATQWRAFLWQNGVMTDLGTLGNGNDAVAGLVNAQGQVVGVSYTNTVANQTTGIPTQDPFFWEQGKPMVDMGTLGGTLGYPTWLNNQGQVVGQSNLAGDKKYHPFLWQKGKRMRDLGTLGGGSGTAMWINDAGEIVGGAWTTGNRAFHAVLWKNGKAHDLGVLRGYKHSLAYGINSKGQIVGCVTNDLNHGCSLGFLWQNGTMYDLNKLVPHGSGLTLTMPLNINVRGEIATWGSFNSVFVHAALLSPKTKQETMTFSGARGGFESARLKRRVWKRRFKGSR
jgi:probable HAF family extracellular repeat protein